MFRVWNGWHSCSRVEGRGLQHSSTYLAVLCGWHFLFRLVLCVGQGTGHRFLQLLELAADSYSCSCPMPPGSTYVAMLLSGCMCMVRTLAGRSSAGCP